MEGDEVLVEAIASGNWIANPVDGKKEIAVTAPDPFVDGKVIVVAANGRGKSDMKALYFSAAEVTVVNATTTTPAVADAGDVTVSVTSNVEYTVSIPAAATWITYNPTKAFTRELTFELEENTGVTRSATISLIDSRDIAIQTFEIIQAGKSYKDVFVTVGENEVEGFAWQGAEVFSVRLLRNSDSKADRYTFFSKEPADTMAIYSSGMEFGPSATFDFGEYIFYPFSNSIVPTFNLGTMWSQSTTPASVYMGAEFYGTAAKPMQSMPLIGVKGDKRVYTFHAATGFLKLKVTDVNSALAYVEVKAPGKKLNGTFALSGEAGAEYLAMAESETAAEQIVKISYSDIADAEEATFIIPITVGTLPAGTTITARNANGDDLGNMSLTEPLEIARNVLSDAGSFAMEANYGANFTLSGTAAAIKANVDIVRSASSVKLVLADTADDGYSILNEGTSEAIATLTADGEVTLSSAEVSKSGACVLVVRTYADTQVQETYSANLYCLKADDAAVICKKHETTGSNSYTGSYTNLELVEFDGMTSAGAAVTTDHRIFTTLYWLKDNPAKWAGTANPEFSAGPGLATIYDGSGYFSFTVGTGDGVDDNDVPFFYYGDAMVILFSSANENESYPQNLRFVITEGRSDKYVDVNDTYLFARFYNPSVSGARASNAYASNVVSK